MTTMKSLLLLPLALLSAVLLSEPASGQSGLELPCLDCPVPEISMRTARPAGGLWYNPQQSGTGFVMDIQGDVLAGYYYLYDDQGEPVWYTFNSLLEPSEDPDVRLVAESQLQKFTHGSCLECDYQAPENEVLDTILRIEFINTNYARFSIDDGPYQFINTFMFGMDGSRVFQPYSDYILPELSGGWVFTYQTAHYGSLYSNVLIVMNRANDDPQYAARYYVAFVGGFPGDGDLLYDMGRLDCLNRGELGPLCELVFDGHHVSDTFRDRVFYIRPGDISDSRMFGETEDGWNVEIFRLGQD